MDRSPKGEHEIGYKVMQIEVSNLCSLTCVYCPHPSQLRQKGNMSMDVFKKCIELTKRSDNLVYFGKKFLWLNHFGEPLLNPLLPEFISFAVSRNIEVSFASNDYSKTMFPRDMWKTLVRAGLKGVVLSAHVKSERTLREHIGDIVNIMGIWKPKPEFFHDWAGQVNMDKFQVMGNPAISDEPCDYQAHNMFAVTWDGRVAACCYDIEGGVSLSIDDVLRDGFEFRSIPLCSGCRLGRGDVQWLSDPLVQTLEVSRLRK